jgi:methionyl-tRNA formyltransferase
VSEAYNFPVPIKAVAKKLGLPIHERDTFTGWEVSQNELLSMSDSDYYQLPRPQNESINLIIAVSFGLFVPPRILKSAEYGGLNVHPSLLPKSVLPMFSHLLSNVSCSFRGPAPLQHTLIARHSKTGVTLQTLDEKSFDHGIILAQTPSPGHTIPRKESCTYNDLLRFIKPKAAEMLVSGLRRRAFVPPLVDVGEYDVKDPKNAPKITKEDMRIKLRHWPNADAVYARHRALGRLWSTVQFGGSIVKRVIFEDFEIMPASAIPKDAYIWVPADELNPVRQEVVSRWDKRGSKEDDAIYIRCGNQALRVREITIEGEKKKAASRMALMDPDMMANSDLMANPDMMARI